METTNGVMNMKMSDVFSLPLLRFNNMIHDSEFKIDIRGQFGTTISELDHAVYAINNHDRLTSENARLRGMLKRLISHDNNRKQVIHLMSEADSLIQELEKGDE